MKKANALTRARKEFRYPLEPKLADIIPETARGPVLEYLRVRRIYIGNRCAAKDICSFADFKAAENGKKMYESFSASWGSMMVAEETKWCCGQAWARAKEEGHVPLNKMKKFK